MRWFFLLLLLTNLALAGWLYWHDDAQSAEPVMSGNSSGQGRLQLLGELPSTSLHPIPASESTVETPPPATSPSHAAEAPNLEPSTAKEKPAGKEQQALCVRVSSLPRLAELEDLRLKLAQANLTVFYSGEEIIERQTYWVMIPPFKTSNAARDAAALLAKAKVRDFLVIRSGEFKNGISLGLFSQKEGADSRLQEIMALKLNIRQPEVRQRTSSVHSYWLITQVSSDEMRNTLQQVITAEGLQATPVECPVITR